MDLMVRAPDLDPNGHVNNAVHLDWLDEAVRAAGHIDHEVKGQGGAASRTWVVPRRYRVEYLAPLALDETASLWAWRAGNGWSVLLTRGSDGRDVARGRLVLAADRPA
jgi:acyl-CoA thioesterase FadM